jgi:uncharacterized membrane protein
MTPAASRAPAAAQPALARRIAWGGFWLGFALGGFFDGIILHQILQWHHLLSGVAPTATMVARGPFAVGCLSWTRL